MPYGMSCQDQIDFGYLSMLLVFYWQELLNSGEISRFVRNSFSFGAVTVYCYTWYFRDCICQINGTSIIVGQSVIENVVNFIEQKLEKIKRSLKTMKSTRADRICHKKRLPW
jgi:hypothetical protein